MVCKIIDHLGLQKRETSALACTNWAHADLVSSLRKELRIRETMHELRFAFSM